MTTKIYLYGPTEEAKELACRLSLIADIGSVGCTNTGDDSLVCREIEVVLDDGLAGRLVGAAALLTAVTDDIGGGVGEHLEAAIEHIIRALHILDIEGTAGYTRRAGNDSAINTVVIELSRQKSSVATETFLNTPKANRNIAVICQPQMNGPYGVDEAGIG